jgi:magnesium transporter
MAPPEPNATTGDAPRDLYDSAEVAELRDAWPLFDQEERLAAFHVLPRAEAEDLFLDLDSADQAAIVLALPPSERRSWLRLLAPDDAADLLQQVPADQRPALIALLDDVTKKDVAGLLAFAEDDAGGLMNPRYARLRPDMLVDEAITYLRRLARDRASSTIYYAYALDAEQRLLGVVSLRDLFTATPDKRIRDVMRVEIVKADETMDQEALGRLFQEHDLVAVPVVDPEGRMKGVVTVDDIVDVVQEEATEDIQKMGGTQALGAPYLRTTVLGMVKKRVPWLALLFVGEMLTANAMGFFEHEIQRAVVLTLFIPLIISSGGNSGSQATTLVIRAMALGEVRLRDWWHVARREILSGVSLGAILGAIGLCLILGWHEMTGAFAPSALRVAGTVAVSLVGVVTWGTLAGSMLPFVLSKFGLDPASASAPFVATLVDVSGIFIYFTVAAILIL